MIKQNKVVKGGAIINCTDEEFLMISSTTCLTSTDRMTVEKTENNMGLLDAISKSGLQLLVSEKLTINREDSFDGYRVKLADIIYNYKSIDDEVVQFEADAPRKTVAVFKGAYSSINGDFIVSCNNHRRRCCYFGGTLNKEANILAMRMFHTRVAKPLHNITVAMPEVDPVLIASQSQADIEIILIDNLIEKYQTGDKIVVRIELSAQPTTIGTMQVVAKV